MLDYHGIAPVQMTCRGPDTHGATRMELDPDGTDARVERAIVDDTGDIDL
jgi:hypothetical protein